MGGAGKTSHSSAHRGGADGQWWVGWDSGIFCRQPSEARASGCERDPSRLPKKRPHSLSKRRRKMLHIRSPGRELGHPRVRETLFIILPHFGSACPSVKLRHSGQKAPYFYYLRAKKVPLYHNNKSHSIHIHYKSIPVYMKNVDYHKCNKSYKK